MTRRPPTAPAPAAPQWLSWLGLAARVIVGAVLAFSGAGKAGSPVEEFAAAIEAYDILPQGLVMPAAAILPWAETLAGFALLGGWLTRGSAAAAFGLFAAFITALLSTMARRFELVDCGCFGFGLHLAPSQTVFLDAVLACAAAWIFFNPRTALSLDSWAKEGS